MNPVETTIGEYLIQQLYSHGVHHVFGIPGDYVLGFFKQMEKSKIRIVNTSDEQGAGFAADAYARIKGLGAVCITWGVGGLKVANTTGQAFAEESPVVVISGAPGREEKIGNPMLHHKVKSFDTQLKVFELLTVAQAVIDNPETACAEIDRVLGAAICYRRPVYIELGRDMVFKKVIPPEHKLVPPEFDHGPFHEAIREAEEMINKAKQPVIITGVELLRYGQHHVIKKLVEKTNIPVAATILAKSAIGERHPLYIGVYEGGMSRDAVRQYVETSDCVILLGVFLTDINMGIFTAKLDQGNSIHSTSEKTSIRYHAYPGVYLSGFLQGLLKSDIRRRENLKLFTSPEPSVFKAIPGQKVTVERLFQKLESILTENTFVISDTGDALFAATDIIVPKAAEFMSSAYYASLGFAVPASVGVQLALPHLRPMVIVGDGAFQMTGMELATVARNRLNPIVIVLNNYGYGTERPMMDGSFNDVYTWRHSQIPAVLNTGRGFDIRTEDDLETALKEAFENTESFSILDIHLDPHDFSSGLKRLTEALGKKVKENSQKS
jgi:TPP-dependent 2-oxoacid decarboxylase